MNVVLLLYRPINRLREKNGPRSRTLETVFNLWSPNEEGHKHDFKGRNSVYLCRQRMLTAISLYNYV